MPGLAPISGAPLASLLAAPEVFLDGNAEGNAHTAATGAMQMAGTADVAEGNAHTVGGAGFRRQAAGDIEGNAFTSGDAFFRVDGAGGVNGNAFTAAQGFFKLDAAADVAEGNAFTSGVLTLILSSRGAALAQAFTTAFAEQFSPIDNPALGLPTAVFTLTVAGTPVSGPLFNLKDLAVNYDGKELSFSEIASPGPGVLGIGAPSFSPEDTVTLDADLGNGSFRWFTGALRVRETIGQNNNEGFCYTAFGYQRLADEVTLTNTNGRPDIQFTVGTTVTSVRSDGTDVVTIFSKTIAEAMQDLFDINATNLSSVGIPATIGSPGLSQFTSSLPETLRLQNIGFAQAVTQLAALETGVKPFFNDQQQAWSFPNLLLSPTALLEFNDDNVTEAVFDLSTEDRYTAVRLLADVDDFLDEAIASKSNTIDIDGNVGVISRQEVTLTKRWLEELEVDWTVHKAHQGTLGNLEDEFFWVFRRWSLPDSIVPQWPGTPIRLWQKYNFWGVETWRRTHGRVLFDRREFHSRFPLIHRGNPHVPGDVIGPIEVKMAYYPLQFPFTFVSSVNSVGTPVSFANTLIDGNDFPTEVRVPPSGFTGSAFDFFGVERELVQIVNRTEVTSANANNLLRLHKDVVVTGDIPVEGDPVEQVLNLDRKVRMQHATLVTGTESYPALLTGYSYRFGKRGENSLSLTTDVSGLIPGSA